MVFFEVGLMGEGEIGVRGVVTPGDFNDSEGREAFCAAEMLKVSLGLAARAAYMIRSFFDKVLSLDTEIEVL